MVERAHSILFLDPSDGPSPGAHERPACFRDLALDQLVDQITQGLDEYDLNPYFHTPLSRAEEIRYRQEVFQDLESSQLIADLVEYSARMKSVRGHLQHAAKSRYPRQQHARFLEAAFEYAGATRDLAVRLEQAKPRSLALRGLQDFLQDYLKSVTFVKLEQEISALKQALASVSYCVLLRPGRIDVWPVNGEPDYSAEVLETFRRFQQEAAKSHLTTFTESTEMNHVEAAVLDRVALLFPEVFEALAQFSRTQGAFLAPTLRTFDREIQFYLAYAAHVEDLRRRGLPFCLPAVDAASRRVSVRSCFDLALASSADAPATVVLNDIDLRGRERILVVTGPNQGGKTTYARTFGQIHYLARLGVPVAAERATVHLCDGVFTHFERSEDLSELRGKLEDDLVRIRQILDGATKHSVIVMNEIFTSTTFRDALFLGTEILVRISERDALAVCVTFVDELSRLNDKVVSVVAGIDPDDQTRRTFRIERRPADGKAYAAALAGKHRLGYSDVVARMAR